MQGPDHRVTHPQFPAHDRDEADDGDGDADQVDGGHEANDEVVRGYDENWQREGQADDDASQGGRNQRL